jgi:hypothetical protein
MSLFLDSYSNSSKLRTLNVDINLVSIVHVIGNTFYVYSDNRILREFSAERIASGSPTNIPSIILDVYQIGNTGNELVLAGIKSDGIRLPIYTLTEIKRANSLNVTPIEFASVPDFSPLTNFIDRVTPLSFAYRGGGSIYQTYNPRIDIQFPFRKITKSYAVRSPFPISNVFYYKFDEWTTYSSISLGSVNSGVNAIMDSLCESQNASYFTKGLGCMLSDNSSGIFRITPSTNNAVTIDYIDTNLDLPSPIIITSNLETDIVSRITSDGKIWFAYRDSLQIYRRFSPNFGVDWYEQQTIPSTFKVGGRLEDKFKISEDGKNHIILASNGVYVSTNYGY